MSQYKYTIKNNDLSVFGAMIITLEPQTEQDVFNFKPGQYVMLSFYDSAGRFFINHPFSIASSPTQTGFIVFGIKVFGKFTQSLQGLKIGNRVDILGPFGTFVFDENKYQEAVFIAGGIGITPFISSAYYAADKKLNNKITLLYSARTVKDALFYEDIKKLTSANPSFKAKIKITQETVTTDLGLCENGYITKETITENIDSVIGKDFFLCGPSPFMKVMEDNLLSLGVSPKNIHQEAFNAMQNLSFRKNYKNIFLVYGFSLALFLVTLYFIGFKELSLLFKEKSENNYQKTPISLINGTVNNRRDNLINSKKLLISTINSQNTKIVTNTNQPVISSVGVTPKTVAPVVITPRVVAPVVNTPIVNSPVVTPVVNVPVVNTPVATPVTPRTRVS